MALPNRLFAVVTHNLQPVTQKKNVVEIRHEKFRELATKKAIDRAARVLDTMEQRASEYDAEIERITQQYLKPLQQRRACAQRRIERVEDQIIGKFSEANIEHADGFHRELQMVACPKAVQVDNLSAIPNEYIRNKPEADKVAIKRALERDRDLVIPGVHLTQKMRLVRK
jgi:hypothetical protein